MKRDLKILLVEDDKDFRTQVAKLLSVYCRVDCVGSIAEARKAIQTKPYDVAILDKGLPDGNGLEFIPELKRENPRIAVIVLTGDSRYNELEKWLSRGAHDYVIKTENIEPELLLKIPTVLERIAKDQKLRN